MVLDKLLHYQMLLIAIINMFIKKSLNSNEIISSINFPVRHKLNLLLLLIDNHLKTQTTTNKSIRSETEETL